MQLCDITYHQCCSVIYWIGAGNPWSHSYLAMDTICPILAPLSHREEGSLPLDLDLSLCARPRSEYLLGSDGCCLNGWTRTEVASTAGVEAGAACSAGTTLLVLCCPHPGLDQIRKSERPPAAPRPVSPVLHSSLHCIALCRTLQASVIPNSWKQNWHCKEAAKTAELEIFCRCFSLQ